jgi:flagellar biosynthesis protein FliP
MRFFRAVSSLTIATLLTLAIAIPARSEAPSAVPGADAFPANAAGPAASFPSSGPASEPPVPFLSAPEAQGTANYAPASPAYVPAAPATGLQLQGISGQTVPWSIVVLLTGLTLIPTILLCVTPFARLLIVFHFLRQALGLQTTPSNQTLIGLSLILTFFLMQPVGAEIYQASVVPMQAGQITAMEAVNRGLLPMRKFMVHYVREKDVALFVDLAKEPRPNSPDDLSMRVLLPAYILSELKAGFQIGTVLFLPFLIVDMVVASITTSVGMLQLPPVVISTPLKLLLFLMVDGWHLLIGSLMRSFS